MIPEKLQSEIERILSEKTYTETTINNASSVSGGSINQAYCIDTEDHQYFLKYNDANRYPGMFETEAKGLQILKNSKTLYTPEVIATGNTDNESFILMEYVEPVKNAANFWQEFGQKLAATHRKSADQFGLDHDNYIGSLPQSNRQHSDWAAFFIEERLEPQCEMARNAGKLNGSTMRAFEKLFYKLEGFFPEEPPSLLHGDLWSGNFLKGPLGEPCLIDPAVYYGHREMDIGMSKLFGGFEEDFYKTYNAAYPMESGWSDRISIANLYPLMVHVNLFGGGYLSQAEIILRKFV